MKVNNHKKFFTFLLVSIMSLFYSTTAFASTASQLGLSNSSASDIGKSALTKFTGPFKIFGGVAIAFSLMTVAFALVVSHNSPQKRTEVLKAIPWIAGGSFLIGSISMIAGFVIGLGS